MNKNICIFGTGGFAKEVFLLAEDCGYYVKSFVGLTEGVLLNKTVITEDQFDLKEFSDVIVAVGSLLLRKQITEKLIKLEVNFATLIHPSSNTMGLSSKNGNVKIGRGSIISANCIITCDIVLGEFSQLNLGTTIGHDVVTGSYFTTAPNVAISGNVNVGNNVSFGTSSSIIENKTICDDVIIGAAACVTKNILESGTYVGVPAIKIRK